MPTPEQVIPVESKPESSSARDLHPDGAITKAAAVLQRELVKPRTRRSVLLAGLAAAKVFAAERAFAQLFVYLPHVESSPKVETSEEKLKKLVQELASDGQNKPEVRLVNKFGSEQDFDGKAELLQALLEMTQFVSEYRNRVNAVRTQFNLTPPMPARNDQTSITLTTVVVPTSAGASVFADENHQEQVVYSNDGSPWEWMRALVEIMLPEPSLDPESEAEQKFSSSTVMREVAVRRITTYLLAEYKKQCESKSNAGEPVSMMRLRDENSETVYAPQSVQEYSQYLDAECRTRRIPLEEPYGPAIPRIAGNSRLGVKPNYGESTLWLSDEGSLDGQQHVFASHLRRAETSMQEEINQWLIDTNRVTERGDDEIPYRDYFELHWEMYSSGQPVDQNGQLDLNNFAQYFSSLQWGDLVTRIQNRLQLEGFTYHGQKLENALARIEQLPTQQPFMQFIPFGDVGDKTLRVLATRLTTEQVGGRLTTRQDDVDSYDIGLTPYMQVAIPLETGGTYSAVVQPAVMNWEGGMCNVIFAGGIQYVHPVTGETETFILTGREMKVQLALVQNTPSGESRTQLFEQVTTFKYLYPEGPGSGAVSAEETAVDAPGAAAVFENVND